MRKFIFILIIVIFPTACIEKSGYYNAGENRIISLICDITWAKDIIYNDNGSTYQEIYQFNRDGTFQRLIITTSNNGAENTGTLNGQWSFYDPAFNTIYFGNKHYWDIDKLNEKKFAFYDRSGEFGEIGMSRTYKEMTPYSKNK